MAMLWPVLIWVARAGPSSPQSPVGLRPQPGWRPIPPAPPQTRPLMAPGDPVTGVQCPTGYTATVYAEGLSSPDGLAFSPDGQLYVAEEAAGQVSRIETDGSATPVLTGLSAPEGIAFDTAGNLYVVEDVQNGRLLKMTPAGITSTLATGLDAPEGVVWATNGTIYLTESNVQFTSPLSYQTGVAAVVPPSGPASIRTDNLLWSYAGITLGPDGLLYVANEASGIGTNDSLFTIDPNTGERTLFASYLLAPEGLRFATNNQFPLYVVEEDTGGGVGKLNRVEANGSHFPFCTGFGNLEDVIMDGSGRLYVSEDSSGRIIVLQPGPVQQTRARAIILLIGDGMGEAQRRAGRWLAQGRTGALAMDLMPFMGWARTASANSAVTDSAAAATAIATGVKTNNGRIGQDPDGNPLPTILEQAQAKGMAVGLVSVTQMAHATPAAFAAHVSSRTMMTDIAAQMILTTAVDVLLGGGEDEFLPITATGHYPQPGERTDGLDLIAQAQTAGYTYVYDAATLNAVNPISTSRLLGLFADKGMERPFSPSLAEMTQKAIDILSQDPDGFFLMVEGGQIDWAGHANDAANMITDTVDFDQAVAVAKNYAATTDNVLVIVTGDHETGGMSLSLTSSGAPDEDGPFAMPDSTLFYVNWITTSHTAVDIPTTAQGPWAHLLAGSYENTHIYNVMWLALGGSFSYLPVILKN